MTDLTGSCEYCSEPVEAGQQHSAFMHPVHYACGLRMLVGSIGHQKKKCSCYGGAEEDPPDLTRRQAAAVAAEYFVRSYKTSA